MKPNFEDGYLGLECLSYEITEISHIAALIGLATEAPDADRCLSGIRCTTEMLVDRLDDIRERMNLLVREWQGKRNPA